MSWKDGEKGKQELINSKIKSKGGQVTIYTGLSINVGTLLLADSIE